MVSKRSFILIAGVIVALILALMLFSRWRTGRDVVNRISGFTTALTLVYHGRGIPKR